MKYDYLVVGAGLFGSVIAYRLRQLKKSVLVIDKRNHIGGNCYCENIENINVHKYGAHIFHTSSKKVWKFVNKFVKFNNYINCPIVNYNGEIYNLPFNMNTFSKLWNICSPEEAINKINEQKNNGPINNLEDQALSLVGKDIYEKFIKEYTEKQWGRLCKDLPASIIKRLPVRFTYNNNYFNDTYQGIPIGGYNMLFEKLLKGCDIKLSTIFDKNTWKNIANNLVYTGPIDEYFEYKYGHLEYRSLNFENEILDIPNYQGNAVVNYTSKNEPYTRIIEHKHFEKFNNEVYQTNKTIITKEYSVEWDEHKEPYYPVNNDKNNNLFSMYKNDANKEPNVIFGGRLADYAYYDMDDTILAALNIKII